MWRGFIGKSAWFGKARKVMVVSDVVWSCQARRGVVRFGKVSLERLNSVRRGPERHVRVGLGMVGYVLVRFFQ